MGSYRHVRMGYRTPLHLHRHALVGRPSHDGPHIPSRHVRADAEKRQAPGSLSSDWPAPGLPASQGRVRRSRIQDARPVGSEERPYKDDEGQG